MIVKRLWDEPKSIRVPSHLSEAPEYKYYSYFAFISDRSRGYALTFFVDVLFFVSLKPGIHQQRQMF